MCACAVFVCGRCQCVCVCFAFVPFFRAFDHRRRGSAILYTVVSVSVRDPYARSPCRQYRSQEVCVHGSWRAAGYRRRPRVTGGQSIIGGGGGRGHNNRKVVRCQ